MTPVEIGDALLTALALGPAASYTSPGENRGVGSCGGKPNSPDCIFSFGACVLLIAFETQL